MHEIYKKVLGGGASFDELRGMMINICSWFGLIFLLFLLLDIRSLKLPCLLL